eukprot:2614070-Prymnesium_polylepis.1
MDIEYDEDQGNPARPECMISIARTEGIFEMTEKRCSLGNCRRMATTRVATCSTWRGRARGCKRPVKRVEFDVRQ